MKNKNLKNKGITIPLSYIALAIILLSIGAIATYFFIYQTKLTTQVATSELAKEETRLLEKISLVYWGSSGCIISNDGEISVSIKKIYVDSSIINLPSPIIINPHEKKEISIPSGQNLMIETSSGKLIKLVEKGFTITQQTTWVGSLPSEITTTTYVPTTITTTQTSVSPTTITTTKSTTQTLTSYISTTYTTTQTSTITQTITTTTPITITQTSSTTQTITSYIPTTYTTTYATTGTQTITTTIPTTITTTKSTTQTLTSYIPTTYTTTQTLTQTNTITLTTTRTVIPTTITSSYLTTTVIPFSTAYFRGDTDTINGLSAYKLSYPQSNIEQSNRVQSASSCSGIFGIRIWKRSSSGVETEITSGSPVAQVGIGAYEGAGLRSATWNRPAISLSTTDSIVVRVYGKVTIGSGDTNWKLLATFSTPQLGITSLPAGTWTVYYYLRFAYEWGGGPWGYYYRFYFHWGTTDKNSRIENFAPITITATYTTSTTITTITDYLGSIFIGEKSPIFLITLGIIITSITIEIRERIKNEKKK
ncbi:MAG: hypothetical protein QXK24_05360 [Ignisphaera sp.]